MPDATSPHPAPTASPGDAPTPGPLAAALGGDPPVVVAEALTKRYGSFTAVDAVDFEVKRGEVLGLLGPNGAGKSTTMRMLYQVTPPTSGRLSMFGLTPGRDARAIKRRLGVVPQIDNLDEELSVRDNLRLYGRYHGLPPADARRRADELLAFADLEGKATVNVRALSGGMKRRLTLARGLVGDPDLVILDEPTTGLDPQVRLALWEKLADLKARGATLLMSTHYMDEAERLSDRLLIMDGGRIVAQGTPRGLIADALRPFVVEGRPSAGEEAPFARLADAVGEPLQRSGGRVAVFVDDGPAALRQVLADGAHPDATFVRPADLEDLFLRLTGHGLRE
ncbi:MAG: ABC transporter ATP-binding protein [Trueperaceae bacterium]|nr:ABC transporter ATP-binding protein [Trueperaceae bacterium]